jgi:hypothetical protein
MPRRKSPVPAFYEQKFFEEKDVALADSSYRYLSFWGISLSRILPPFAYRSIDHRLAMLAKAAQGSEKSDWEVYLSMQNAAERAVMASKMSTEYLTSSLWVGASARRALFFHTKLSHGPHKLTEYGEFGPGNSDSHSLYATHALIKLLDRLRSLNSYDDALIIVVSDHGGLLVKDPTMGGIHASGMKLPAGFNPLMMVKLPDARGPFEESLMTVWLGDVATTVRDFLDVPMPDGPMFQSRSLLTPDEIERSIEVPLFYRSDQASYHDSLSNWGRLEASGKFQDYGPASKITANHLLKKQAEIELFSGIDAAKTDLVAKGWLSGKGAQYVASIEIDGLLIVKRNKPGIVILSNDTGVFKLTEFSEFSDAISYLQNLAADTTVFAAGLSVPRSKLVLPILKDALDSGDSSVVNFSLYVGGADSTPLVKVSKGDTTLSEAWIPVGN